MAKTFYSQTELTKFNFKSLGKNASISRFASIITPESLSVGDNTRIDDFCVLSGDITLGSYVHISTHCSLFGTFGIEIGDFSGMSSNTIVYSATDDFSGNALIGPQVPSEFRNITGGKVFLHKFVQLGAGSILMPGVTLHEGSATGALTLVKTDLPAWTISAGIPSRVIKKRDREILQLASSFIQTL